MNGEPNTPGVLGYLLCSLVAFGTCAVMLVGPAALGNGDPAALLYVVPVALVVMVGGFPVALVGVLAMELSCRGVRTQRVHVAVAAVTGGAATLGYLHAMSLDLGLLSGWIAVVVGGSAAAGRASVIPLVYSRRNRAAVAGLGATPRW